MKLRKILAVLLALSMALSTAAMGAAAAFTDVAEDAYYADAVAWAAEKKITEGRGDGIFDPDVTVTRAEAVTFLWRMAGQPAPTQTATFADVEADASNFWYKTAVQWAVEKGITNGTGTGFSPYVTCSRGMILTMLYRLNGEPLAEAMAAELPENEEDMSLDDFGIALIQTLVGSIRSGNVIPDVKEGDWYELPIIWAMLMDILTEDQIDAESGAVRPDADCPRGEMVYFLYRASGDAPAEGAIKTGKLSGTVLLDKNGVKITAAGIRSEGTGDVIVDLTVENGSDKLLRVDAEDAFVNTFEVYPQVCIPTKTEDGWIAYPDAVVEPGETKTCEMRLNSLDDKGISAVFEIECRMTLTEVAKSEEGGYDYVDEFAAGGIVLLRTSLYDAGATYDPEGTVLLEKDGLKVVLLGAENNEYSGPEIRLFAYNGGKESVELGLAELKLDGKDYEGFFNMSLPAGKRSVETVSVFIMDFDNIPACKEAVLTLQTEDPETGAPITVFEPVTVSFGA